MPEKVKAEAPLEEEKEKVTLSAFLKNHVTDITSYLGLVIVLILFFASNGDRLMYNLSSVIQSAAVYSVIALGAVFVYSMGFMDISVGQQVGVYVILMILINNKIGGMPGLIVGFLVVLALAMFCGFLNGTVGVLLGLPSVVTSLFLMFFFTGAQGDHGVHRRGLDHGGQVVHQPVAVGGEEQDQYNHKAQIRGDVGNVAFLEGRQSGLLLRLLDRSVCFHSFRHPFPPL